MVLIILGNSCAGKSTLIDILINKLNVKQIKQYTTREKRGPYDNDYNFISYDEYMKINFIHVMKYDGNYYGHSVESFKALDNKIYVTITDSKTAKNIKKICEAKIIFVKVNIIIRIIRMLKDKNRSLVRILYDLKYSFDELSADYVITNNGSVEELEEKIKELTDVWNKDI